MPLLALYDRVFAREDGRLNGDVAENVESLIAAHRHQLYRSVDRRFGWLFLAQWLLWAVFAMLIAPPRMGTASLFPPSWNPLFLDLVLLVPAGYLILKHAGEARTRFVIALTQGLTSLLLIDSMNGRLESCFHIFASMVFLSAYRDWRILSGIALLAVLVPALSAEGVVVGGFALGSGWRWLEYEGWLIFEAVFLIHGCLQSRKEMLAVAEQQVCLIEINKILDKKVAHRMEEVTRLQMELAQADKMISLGQLAAGLAHEINNPLGFLMSNLNTLKRYVETLKSILGEYRYFVDKLHKDEPYGTHKAAIQRIRLREDEERLAFILSDLEDLLLESKEGTVRVKVIVQGLRNFARLNESMVQVYDINAGLQDTLKIARNDLQHTCEITLDLGELPLLRCQPGQLSQAFLNVLINAFQATQEQGEIRIKTRASDTHIIVSIQDTGTGISPEAIDRVFEPFFTTKPVGQGTGLGLAIAYGIIAKHQGVIEVSSQVGQGSTFTINLPLVPEIRPNDTDVPDKNRQSVPEVLVGGG